jgi:hypothetical protein
VNSAGMPFEALTPPAPLSQRERGKKGRKSRAFSFLPPLPLGEEGRGGEGFGGHVAYTGKNAYRNTKSTASAHISQCTSRKRRAASLTRA